MGCCPKGEPPDKFFVNPNTKASSCCPSNALGYIDGKCIFPEPPQPSPSPCPAPKPQPQPPKDVCGQHVCPPDENDMAMEYGKCYRLINAGSKLPLALNNDYRTDQENSIWRFRVCRNTKNCTPDGTVKADHKFVLNDVIGKAGEGPWFICQGAHYGACKDEKSVKQFNAQKWCTSGGSGICLTALPTGIGRACQMDDPLVTMRMSVCVCLS